MFLAYATAAVFAFAIPLNIFYLHSPAESAATGFVYEYCEDCLMSECHLDWGRPCLTRWDVEYNFTCYMCAPENGTQQFYSKKECKKGCTDPSMKCICDGSCYMCIVKKNADLSKYLNCTVPVKEEEPLCK